MTQSMAVPVNCTIRNGMTHVHISLKLRPTHGIIIAYILGHFRKNQIHSNITIIW